MTGDPATCPQCSAPVTQADRFCESCGTLVRNARSSTGQPSLISTRARNSGASTERPSRLNAKPQATMQASTSRLVPSLSASTRPSGRDSTPRTSTPSLIGITPST